MDLRGAQKGLFFWKKGSGARCLPGIHHRLRGEAADQEWNAYARKGNKIAAADGRSTAEAEDGKHTSGGVLIGIGKKSERESLEDNEGIIVQMWVHCKGELQIFAAYFCHAVSWTARNDAVLDTIKSSHQSNAVSMVHRL